MNEMPFSRDGLRKGLSEAVAELGIELKRPVFWEQNRTYHAKPNMEMGDLWLYYNRPDIQKLLDVIDEAFAYIDFRPAATEISAQKARTHLATAYVNDTSGIRTFLEKAPPYLHAVVRKLLDEGPLRLTPELTYDAIHAFKRLDSILSKQQVASTANA